MIKLQRGAPPKVLIDDSASWLKSLQDAITLYGSYKKIPIDQRDKLVSHYRHKDIQQALSKTSHGKCAFCECHPAESSFIQVEHFKPKSIYPDSTFQWDNFLPVCGQCNTAKSTHDTGVTPIINPYDTDPLKYFVFDLISIKPIPGPAYNIAELTIEVCGLQGIRLWKPRADILVSLTGYSEAITAAIADYEKADTDRKRDGRIRKLRESIETIESLAAPESKFSAFCTHFLRNCNVYKKAKMIVTAHPGI